MHKAIYDENPVKLLREKYFNPDGIYLTYMSARKKYEPTLSSKMDVWTGKQYLENHLWLKVLNGLRFYQSVIMITTAIL